MNLREKGRGEIEVGKSGEWHIFRIRESTSGCLLANGNDQERRER